MDFLGFLCGAPTLACSLCQRGGQPARQCCAGFLPLAVPAGMSGFGASQPCGITLWFWCDGEKLPSPPLPPVTLQSLSRHSSLTGAVSNPDSKHSLTPGQGFFVQNPHGSSKRGPAGAEGGQVLSPALQVSPLLLWEHEAWCAHPAGCSC